MINLSDFPSDVFVLLEEDYRARFFKTIWKLRGGYRKLAEQFGVTKVAMLGWRRALHSDRKPSFCPIWVIKKISKTLTEEGFKDFSLEKVQSNLISYRAKHGIIVNNPILPLEDSVQLRQFVMHLICDGTAQNIPHRTCKYGSTSIEAVEEFRGLLRIFGTAHRKVTVQKRNPHLK